MLSGRIRNRNGQVVIEMAGRPENPVEGGLAIATVHTARNNAYPVLWLEPAYGLVYVLRGAVDIAVLDRTGEVLQVFSQVDKDASPSTHVGIRALTQAPIAIVGRSGCLGDRVVPGMVLFWQDRPLVPLVNPPKPQKRIRWDEEEGWSPAYTTLKMSADWAPIGWHD